MIKLLREGSRKYPWILKIIMLILAVTFIIGMGWFGYETSQQPSIVAVVGAYGVEAREFRRAYNAASQFRKNQNDQDVTDAELKQNVLSGLIGQKLWLVAADDFEVDVHPDELRRAIMTLEEFTQDGAFDPGLYHRLLARQRISPKQFEGQIADSLRAQKVRDLVQDVATLTPADMEEIEDLAARQAAAAEDGADYDTIKTRIRLELLYQKRQRALQAYQAALNAASHVEIRNEFL